MESGLIFGDDACRAILPQNSVCRIVSLLSASEHAEDCSEQREKADRGYTGMEEYNWFLRDLTTQTDRGQHCVQQRQWPRRKPSP